MAINYTVAAQQDSVKVNFTELPENTVFVRVERRRFVEGAVDPVQVPALLFTSGVSQGRWQARLTWTISPPITLNVERRRNKGDWLPVSTSNASGSFTDSGAADSSGNGRYEYRLSFQGTYSNVVELVRGVEPPSPIAYAVAGADPGTVVGVVSWQTRPGLTVNVERRQAAGWSVVSSGDTSGLFVDTGVTPGVYYYRLVRNNLAGAEVQVNTREPIDRQEPVLYQPTVSAAGSRYNIELRIAAQPPVPITIQRRRKDDLWTNAYTDTTQTSITDNVPAGNYDYRIIVGNTRFEHLSVATGDIPPTPTLRRLVSLRPNRRPEYVWTNTPRIDVAVERRRNLGSWSVIDASETDGSFIDSIPFRSSSYGRYDTRLVLNGVAGDYVTYSVANNPSVLTAETEVSADGRRIMVTLRWPTPNTLTSNLQRRHNEGSWATIFSQPPARINAQYVDTVSNVGEYEYRLLVQNVVRNIILVPTPSPQPDAPPVPPAPTGTITPATPTHPPVPPRTPVTVWEYPREQVTGLFMDGELFNLPTLVGSIRGADGDTQDWLWIVETRRDFDGSVVLRYNPVSGQGWLFTTEEVTRPADIAASDNLLAIAEDQTVHLFTKPLTVRGDTPDGVLSKTGDFTLSASPQGITYNNTVFYANIDGTVSSYDATNGNVIARYSNLPSDAENGTITFSRYGLFAGRRNAANPATFWRHLQNNNWQVLQSDVEPRVSALASTSDRIYLIDREAGFVTPYTVNTPELLTGFEDRFAPLGSELEYRVGAQGFNLAYENGGWIR